MIYFGLRCRYAAILLILTCEASSQEWTAFRGPSGQGIGEGASLPAQFEGSHEIWRVDSGGKGSSSPVIWGSRVFITREGPRESERQLVCFDAATGQELRSKTRSFIRYPIHRSGTYADSTPAVDQRAIYTVWRSGDDLVALALTHDLKKVWRRRVTKVRRREWVDRSPILHKNHLIVTADTGKDISTIVAMNVANGKVEWSISTKGKRGAICISNPTIIHPVRGKEFLLISVGGGGLLALDPRTGSRLWYFDCGFGVKNITMPCVSGEHVLVSAGVRDVKKTISTIIRLPGKRASKPRVVRRMIDAGAISATPIALEEIFYLPFRTGEVSAASPWMDNRLWKTNVRSAVQSSPVSNGKYIYIADAEGKIHTFEVGSVCRPVGVHDLKDAIVATPAIALGSLFVRTTKCLLRLSSDTSKKPGIKKD